MHRGFQLAHLRERDYLCDISVDGRVILKNKYGRGRKLWTSDSGYGQVVGILSASSPLFCFNNKDFLCIKHTVEHNCISPSSTVGTQLHVSVLYVGHLQVVI